MEVRHLRGSCTCGRNRYVVEVPPDRVKSEAIVFIDNSSDTRRVHASPLTAFLRVPLTWLRSSTHAFYSDEDHSSIRRTYTTPLAPGTRRQFCGYCGTQLTTWSERRREDAEFISLTLGSMLDEDVAILDTMGVLPSPNDDVDDDELQMNYESLGDHMDVRNGAGAGDASLSSRHVWTRGSPWFENMIEDSGLARVRRRYGSRTSDGDAAQIEIEIIEIDHDPTADTGGGHSGAKRKYEETSEGRTGRPSEPADHRMSGALQDG